MMGETPASTVPTDRSPSPRKGVTVAHAIFEGGGARGITHIGALAAIEAERISLAGVAGASAGAIVAALIAVGYTADDLYKRGTGNTPSTDILAGIALTPVGLLGPSWHSYTFVRSSGTALIWLAIAILLIVLVIGIGIKAQLLWLLPLAGLPLLPLVISLWPVFSRRGLIASEDLAETLNDLLRERLKLHYEKNRKPWSDDLQYVRFSHLDPAEIPQCLPLKVVVSDVQARRLVIFDRQTNRDAIVADVVAASAAIPFFFRPPTIRGALGDGSAVYADGGLVSNLPVWAFASEKRMLERDSAGIIPTLAFTLIDPPGPSIKTAVERRAWRRRAQPSMLAAFTTHLGAVVRTGIFGSQSVVQGFMADLTVIELHSPLKTLGFDCSRQDADAAYDAGVQQAGTVLRRRRLTSATTGQLLELLRGEAEERLPKIVTDSSPFRLRASIVDRTADGSFRVTATANFADSDADDRLEIDRRGRGAPRAWDTRQPTLAQLGGIPDSDLIMTKYERALQPKDIVSVISVPVFAVKFDAATNARPTPERVLCLDSNADLAPAFADPQFLEWLQGECVLVSLSEIADVVKEQTDG